MAKTSPSICLLILPVCLSVCLSVYLSVCLSVYLSVCLSTCLSNSVSRVTVKSFSGATYDDMFHHIQPTHKPDEIILHVGSNNLRKDSPHVITKKIKNLCKVIQQNCPDTKLASSEIAPRRDFKNVGNIRDQVNKNIEFYCRASNLTFIKHPLPTKESLNTRGVVWGQGSAVLAKDFKNFIFSKD